MRIGLPVMAVGTASGLFAFCRDAPAQPSMGREHILPLFMSTSNLDQQGVVRVINHSDQTATVSIVAVGDSGARKPPSTLTRPTRDPGTARPRTDPQSTSVRQRPSVLEQVDSC